MSAYDARYRVCMRPPLLCETCDRVALTVTSAAGRLYLQIEWAAVTVGDDMTGGNGLERLSTGLDICSAEHSPQVVVMGQSGNGENAPSREAPCSIACKCRDSHRVPFRLASRS